MTKSPQSRITIGEWTIRPELDTVELNGRTVKLEPRLMKVLLTLAGRPGELLTRDEILRTVWPEAAVGDEVLTQAISSLRKHLGDSPRHPRMIQTVPKKGYRLIAPTAELNDDRSTLPGRSPATGFVSPFVAALMLALAVIVPAVLIVVVLVWRDPNPYPPALNLVTAMRGRETDPSISADGSQLAFVWSGESGDSWDLYVKPLLEGEPRRLTSGDALELSPAWSPQGDRIAFCRIDHGSCGVFVIDPVTGRESPIAICRPESYPRIAWSPTGDLLAISDYHGRTGPYVIYTMRPDGTNRTQITEVVPGLGDRHPVFSPDGAEIAFVRSEGMGASDVHVVSSHGGVVRKLTTQGDAIQGVAWAHRDRILFSSRRGGEFSLWSVNRRGGEPRWVGFSGIRAVNPSENEEGLVFEQQMFDSDIWKLDVENPGVSGRLIASTAWEDEPRFSPDGSEITYVSRRSGRPALWLTDRNGRHPRKLTESEFRSVRMPRWSPDGRHIAFAADMRSSADLYLLDRESGTVEQLTNAPGNELAPAWSPDGRTLYFSSDRQGSWEVWTMNLADRSMVPVLPVPAGAMDVTADGKELYFSRLDQTGLWRMTIRDGLIERIVEDFDSSDWANWELKGNQLFYLTRSTPQRIVAMDIRNSEVLFTLPFSMSEDDYGFTVSPDGSTVLFSRGDRTESDLLWLEENRRRPQPPSLMTYLLRLRAASFIY